MAGYAHGFSSEQWEPDPADDDVWDDVVLVVSEAVAVGGMWVLCGVGGWVGWAGFGGGWVGMGGLGGGGGLEGGCLPLCCRPGSGGAGRGSGGRVVGEQERSPWLGCGDDRHQGICGVSIG